MPSVQLAELAINEPSTNPWQPALDEKPLPTAPSHIPTFQREDSGNEAWMSAAPSSAAPAAPNQHLPPRAESVQSEDSDDWNDERTPAASIPTVAADCQSNYEEGHVWDDNGAPRINQDASVASERAAQEEYLHQEGRGWDEQQTQQESGTVEPPADFKPPLPERPEENAPALPPRTQTESGPSQPPRPILQAQDSSTVSLQAPGSPGSIIGRQKKETYEIKKIRWHDVSSASNPRTSPILVQNANGPCPLLALVNALTLSTPAGVDTALVETLRSREQVSLGLLLDAVFDELMSGRRGESAYGLPDVSDLYSFLITLHTGMNVNPRFLPPASTSLLDDIPLLPNDHLGDMPGTFENTREMKLYSTFLIPLIHGWLPQPGEAVFLALSRSAQSYEDAQNLMFREEELEDKLQREGLNFEEQATLEDIATITAFLKSSATQLTQHGLDTIIKHLEPGSIAIFFRNDHFSTLYRHPINHQLLQLVTDAGYSTHDEIVWQSLSDVSGLNCEFFSGDFRLVSGGPSRDHDSNPSTSNTGWTTVGRNDTQHQASASTRSIDATLSQIPSNGYKPPMPQSSNTEQEDHDLALAMQLQEEEEERHRNETVRRQRETELSQQYIESQQGGGQGRDQQSHQRQTSSNAVPVTRTQTRRSQSSVASQTVRPLVPQRGRRADPEAGVDVPPPSYEQAAGQQEYVPPLNHPAHPSSSPSPATSPATAQQRRPSGFTGRPAGNGRANVIGGIAGQPTPAVGRGAGGMIPQQAPKEKDCVVM